MNIIRFDLDIHGRIYSRNYFRNVREIVNDNVATIIATNVRNNVTTRLHNNIFNVDIGGTTYFIRRELFSSDYDAAWEKL
jgi:hypothetical protein